MLLGAQVARHWPFANGSGRILDRFAKGSLGTGKRRAMTSDGFPMNVLADDLIGRHILMTGKFDRSIVQVLLDHAQPSDMLLDIGANIGYVSACFLANVKDSKAVAVEPQPGIVDLLSENLRQFGKRTIIYPVALSDKPGELRFHVDTVNRGASKISDQGEITVPAIRAADLLASLDRLNLIKIDVEGHEEPIFRSIEPELLRLKPRAILFEDHGTDAAPEGKIGSILSRVGYRIFGIEKRLLSTRLVTVGKAEDCRFNDYIAVQRWT